MANIEKLLSRVDLLDLAEKAGAKFIHRNGRDARSACPFHQGHNNTAFAVYQDGTDCQHWHCYRCNEGGDAITFIQRWKGLSFPEAVTELAALYHVGLDEIEWGQPQDIQKEKKKHQERDLLALAARYFYARLLSREGRPALAYVHSRGFSKPTIRAARFGFTNGDTGLRDFLIREKADLNIAREIGLIRADGSDFTANGHGQEASSDGYLIYPHWVGERVVYFSSRAITPKERMPDPKDKSRNMIGPRQVYRAEVHGQFNRVTIVEGPADARSLYQMGYSAWALCGLGEMSKDDLAHLRRKQAVYLATDSDQAGEIALRTGKVAKLAMALGPLVMVLPAIPEGKDFNDWLQVGLTPVALEDHYKWAKTWIETRLEHARDCAPDELDPLMRDVAQLLLALPENSRPRYYKLANSILGLTRSEIQDMIRQASQNGSNGQVLSSIKDGLLRFIGKPLLNGQIEITNELIMDDGQNMPHIRYTVSGKLQGGINLEPLDIEAEEFDQFKWIPRHWGHRIILYISRGQFYELARAIQEVSTEARQERVYTYTGWTTINERRAFLSASGAITGDGLDPSTRVDLGVNNLRYYAIPEPPVGEDRYLSVQASLDFMKLGPRTVTAPLWAAMYAAPLTEIAPLYAVIWVYGQTQSGKSTIAHLALCHYGPGFVSGRQYHAPRDWTSSPTDLEGAMFTIKDAPIIIDDFAPQFASVTDSRNLHRNAHYVIRSVGNRSSRGRARADLSERMIRIPRGLVIATAENPLMGQSIVGRMIYVNVLKGDIMAEGQSPPELNLAQDCAQRGFYAQAMSAYLQWLSVNWERVKDTLSQRIDAAAKQAREANPALQNRLPDYYALLTIAQETALYAFAEMGLITIHEAKRESSASQAAILQVVVQQAERIATESPVRKVIEALGSLLARRKVYLAPRTQCEFTPPPQAELIGWFDLKQTNLVYLETNTCIAQAKAFWSALSENLDIQPDAFLLQVKQITGLINPGDRIEVSMWVAGKTRRVLSLNRGRVIELYGVDISNETASSGLLEPGEEKNA